MMLEFLIAIGAAMVTFIGQVVMFCLQRSAAKKDKKDDNISGRVAVLEADNEKMREALIGILHNELYINCQEIIERKSITVGELDNLNLIYAPYHKLGGNGTGTKLYELASNLPIRDN